VKTLQSRYNRDLTTLTIFAALGFSLTCCILMFIILRQQKLIAEMA